jgi:hypothetical protein
MKTIEKIHMTSSATAVVEKVPTLSTSIVENCQANHHDRSTRFKSSTLRRCTFHLERESDKTFFSRKVSKKNQEKSAMNLQANCFGSFTQTPLSGV